MPKKDYITRSELLEVLEINNEVLLSKMDEKFATKSDLTKLKSDVLDHIDAFAKEIKTNQEERTVQSHHIARNTKRIEKLEKAVFN